MTDVFKSFPFTPPAYPTKDYHVCNKKYVDTACASVSNSFGHNYISCSSVTISNGISAVGFSVGDATGLVDGKFLRVSESAGTPGFNIIFDFSSVTQINYVFIRSNYVGSATHYINIDIYNYDSTSWDAVGTVLHAPDGSWRNIEIPIPDDTDYISSGTSRVRAYHVTAGNATHYIYVDYAALMGVT